MSKPTFNYFCVHTGFFRNDRTLNLREKIGDNAFRVMPILWAYAGESQMDGDMSKLSVRRFREIFRSNHLDLSEAQTRKVVKALHDVGFIQKGKLHSWDKFNRHCVDYEKRHEIRRDAAFSRWRKKVQTEPFPDSHAGNGKDSPSKKLWLIEQALKTAKGRAKKALLVQREELLSEHTGVDLSEQPAAPIESRPRESKPRMPRNRLSNALSKLKDAVSNPVPG